MYEILKLGIDFSTAEKVCDNYSTGRLKQVINFVKNYRTPVKNLAGLFLAALSYKLPEVIITSSVPEEQPSEQVELIEYNRSQLLPPPDTEEAKSARKQCFQHVFTLLKHKKINSCVAV